MKSFTLFLVLAIASLSLAAQFNGGVTLSTRTPELYSKLEIYFDVGSYSNPYNPSEIDVTAKFLSPNNKNFSLPCFYMKSNNAGKWLCRFAPFQSGMWNFHLEAKDNKGTALSSTVTFNAVGSGRVGFVHKSSKDNLHFVRSNDGSTYFPIGENMAWSSQGNFNGRMNDYKDWLSKLAAEGGNYIRVWMDGWNLRPEYHVGNYDSAANDALFIDQLVELADSKKFTILWCMNYHGDFSYTVNSNWGKNPYNKANGGPLSNPADVWTDGTTMEFFKQRYRYTIARWGYSTSVLAWELWNEMDWITDFNKNSGKAATWCKSMYEFIRRFDPYGHLITTSFALDSNRDEIDGALDFIQYHQYGDNHIQDFAGWISKAIPTKTNKFNKPAMVGEFGPSYQSGWYKPYTDASGVCIHNTAFSSLMSGGSGGGFTWWWDNWVQPKNLYWRFRGISSFVRGEQLDGLKPVSAQASDNRLRSLAISDGRKTLGWVQSTSHTWWGLNQGWGQLNLKGASAKAPCSSGTRYTAQIWNTVSGQIANNSSFTCNSGSFTVNLPAYDNNNGDWAYKLIPSGGGSSTGASTGDNSGGGTGTSGTGGSGTTSGSGGSTTGGGGKGKWEYCSKSSECANHCCSKQYSGDGRYKCTPDSNQCI